MIVTGYGAYGINRSPAFNPIYRDQGMAVVETTLRGGGEFGQRWHEQGMLTRKQNVFDDLAAILMQLVERGDTSSGRLTIIGGSDGGLLMGATFTQHPSLVKAVVSPVGIYDMLRVELSPNGEFNVPEFGTATIASTFRRCMPTRPIITSAKAPRIQPFSS